MKNHGLWLRIQIDALYEDILKKVQTLYEEGHTDVHCVACNQIADKWDIWSRDENDDLFLPMWLMHMVGGVMREDRFASYREEV